MTPKIIYNNILHYYLPIADKTAKRKTNKFNQNKNYHNRGVQFKIWNVY